VTDTIYLCDLPISIRSSLSQNHKLIPKPMVDVSGYSAFIASSLLLKSLAVVSIIDRGIIKRRLGYDSRSSTVSE